MLIEAELRTLDRTLRRIVPQAADETIHYVHGRAATQPDLYRAGGFIFQSRRFDKLSSVERDRILESLQNYPSIATIIRYPIEGRYTSSIGMSSIGFRVTD